MKNIVTLFAGGILIFLCSSGAGGASIAFGLVSHYDFNDDSVDSLGGNNGIEYGGVNYVNGLVGKSANFDGINDYIDIGAPASLNNVPALSLSAWIFPRSTANQGVVAKNNGSENDYGFEISAGGRFAFTTNYNYVPQGTFLDGGPVQVNAWHHLVGVWDGSTVRFYRNGAEVNSTAYSGKALADGNQILSFGKLGSFPGWYFDGLLDEVLIYDRPLSYTEIQFLFNSPGIVPEPGTFIFLSTGLAWIFLLRRKTILMGAGPTHGGRTQCR